ncbi:MAG: hypothetical protein WAM66_13340 [Acidobacteriaceae bacterium]
MAANIDTRHHEAGHAVSALALGIEVSDEAMVLISDQEAWVNIPVPDSIPGEDWCTRRAAVKLAGPIAMMRLRDQPLDWDTMRATPEYASDHQDAQRILLVFRSHRSCSRRGEALEEQLNSAALLAAQVVDANASAIQALVEATESRDSFSRDEILGAIEGHLSPIELPDGAGSAVVG